jgi:hypothetical protein
VFEAWLIRWVRWSDKATSSCLGQSGYKVQVMASVTLNSADVRMRIEVELKKRAKAILAESRLT